MENNIIIRTIQWFQDGRRKRFMEHGGRMFVDNNVSNLKPIEEPRLPVIATDMSLCGLVDYLNLKPDTGIDGFEPEVKLFAIVASFNQVDLVTRPYGTFPERDILFSAKAKSTFYSERDGNLRLEMFSDVETMVVTLLTCFEESEDLDYLLKLISNIVISDEKTIKDNGLTQSITVKTGMTTVEEVEIKRFVKLSPRLTFSEVDQPEIVFCVRLTESGTKGDVHVKLVPSNDTAWINKTAKRIKLFLESKVDNLVVLR